jgi:hypothetical protein
VPDLTPEHLVARSVDGTYNDLEHPDMGRAGDRFGRNIPLEAVLPVTAEQLMEPSPREVSRRLLTRTTFQPATTVNTLAASWLQFMIHDWFSHGEGDTSRRRRREGGPDGGAVRGEAAGRFRVQRHRVPRLHPHGLAPELRPALRHSDNAFAPWDRTA